MANSATGRILHVYQGIESHFFPVAAISRAKKSYSSSGPVRYIPGRFAQIGNTQSCKSLQGSANKEAPISGKPTSGLANFDGRRLRNHHFNDEMSSPNNIFEQIGGCSGIEESTGPVPGLYDSDYENMDELNKISKVNGNGFRKTREEIEEVAVGLLAARAMTAIELRKKLRGKKYPSHIIEFIVSDFKSRGLLNDSIYAESFTRSRWLSSTWGPKRIKQALLQKGVSQAETERAIKQVFDEEDSECNNDQNMQQHSLSKLSMDHLLLQASKQWLRNQNTAVDNRRARIVRWLQYRGFDWDVTNYILKQLESQYPP